jgi:hypothetical protein
MFVVDFNDEEAAQEEKQEYNLGVPERTIQGKMVGPVAERDLSSCPENS